MMSNLVVKAADGVAWGYFTTCDVGCNHVSASASCLSVAHSVECSSSDVQFWWNGEG